MSKWAGIAIAGIWIGIGIISFNVGVSAVKDIAMSGFIITAIIAFVDFLSV